MREEVWYKMNDGRAWDFYCMLDGYEKGLVLYTGEDEIYWMKLGLIYIQPFTDKTIVAQRIIKSTK